jgi:hypothetical protein
MKSLFRPALVLTLLALVLNAQSKKRQTPKNEPETEQNTRITLDVSRVNMLFTVSDKKGRFVTDLGKDDFEVFENKKPQSILEFAAEPRGQPARPLFPARAPHHVHQPGLWRARHG